MRAASPLRRCHSAARSAAPVVKRGGSIRRWLPRIASTSATDAASVAASARLSSTSSAACCFSTSKGSRCSEAIERSEPLLVGPYPIGEDGRFDAPTEPSTLPGNANASAPGLEITSELTLHGTICGVCAPTIFWAGAVIASWASAGPWVQRTPRTADAAKTMYLIVIGGPPLAS
jgi:hypothetical protein